MYKYIEITDKSNNEVIERWDVTIDPRGAETILAGVKQQLNSPEFKAEIMECEEELPEIW